MYKFLIAVVLAVVSVGGVGQTVSAATTSVANTAISGQVTFDGEKVKDADVYVECGTKPYYRTDKTNGAGKYGVYIPSTNCPAGSAITITAAYGDASGMAHGIVGADLKAAIDVNLTTVMVPEFGEVLLPITAVAALGGLLYVRRNGLRSQRAL
jgi:hypothetical protein